jgi:hypothetical protein
VLAIINSFDFNVASQRDDEGKLDILKKFLFYYRVENYLQPNTYWFFEDKLFSFKYEANRITINHKQGLENTAHETESYYFPAERIALPMITDALFELTLGRSSLPDYFLQFGKDFTIARQQQRTFKVPLLDVEYAYINGENRVFLPGLKQPLLLQETSSAIQANLPLLVILQYPINIATLLAVEELELHAFPLLQKKLLYYLAERMYHPKLEKTYVVLPTHSPYLLSAANNLLVAARVASYNNTIRREVGEIIPEQSWIESKNFSAYLVENGAATSIVDAESGLIYENALDSVSDEFADEFDALMEFYKPEQA